MRRLTGCAGKRPADLSPLADSLIIFFFSPLNLLLGRLAAVNPDDIISGYIGE